MIDLPMPFEAMPLTEDFMPTVQPYGDDFYTFDYTPPIAGNGDFSWGEILANFGFYAPALDEIAAAIANPTYSNVLAVETAYRRGGHTPPAPLMNWLWSKYARELPTRIPGEVLSGIGNYWPLILLGVVVLFARRR
jgi:uncharacterized protein (TIGR03382 family)